MSRGKDFRETRRRGFDDDNFSTRSDSGGGSSGSGFQMPRHFGGPPRPTATGPVVDAVVKWFNPEKGFGFVEIADGLGDAFLSIKALQAIGKDTVSPGATLSVFVGQGEKGRQVTKIATINDGAAATAPAYVASSASRPRRVEADLSGAKEVLGKVKWFSAEKGMGFVTADDGGKDVFVHISVVKEAGMADLVEGQRISMRVAESAKGRKAVSLETAD
jgi:cold shock protein